LGPLADDDLETARLRETLEVFLTTGPNYTMAADKLHVHRNTIKYRIHNAQDKLLVTTNDGRIDVALALVLCSQLGEAVLTHLVFRVVVRRYTGARFALV
jgi:DNA-binding PucR family transcriptional regulator